MAKATQLAKMVSKMMTSKGLRRRVKEGDVAERPGETRTDVTPVFKGIREP